MPRKFRGSDLPKGWLRFVSLPGDIRRVDDDGTTVASRSAAPEEQLERDGWTAQEIAHATGRVPIKPDPRLKVSGR